MVISDNIKLILLNANWLRFMNEIMKDTDIACGCDVFLTNYNILYIAIYFILK